jgi:predicted alpha/beta superfamily hydrolase
MYTKPQLFESYVAATPAVVLGDSWLLNYEQQFAKSNRSLPVRLYVAVGGNEAPAYMIGAFRINQRINSRKYEGLQYQFRMIDEERHAGMQIEAYTRGLQWAFAPMAPESGPAADR